MKSHKIRKAMVLAAGLGTRLLPVTKKIPKPLVPVLNIANVIHNLMLLKAAGIHDIVLNLHHLGAELERFLGDGRKWGLALHYSHEKVLLGTGGGVKNVEAFFENEPFVLCNCDFISNLNLQRIIDFHFQNSALATMALVDDPKRQIHYSKVGVDANSNIVLFPKLETARAERVGIFTGLHVLETSVLKYLKNEPCGINELVYPALMKETPNKVQALFLEKSEYWLDTGEVDTLLASSKWLLDRLLTPEGESERHLVEAVGGFEPRGKGIWIKRKTEIPGSVRLIAPSIVADIQCKGTSTVGPYAIVGEGSTLGNNVVVEESVLLAGSNVADGKTVSHALYFESSAVAKKA